MADAALILAAGRGTRMLSERPKVLHAAGGRTLLEHVLTAVLAAGLPAADVAVVAGFGADAVRALVEPRGCAVRVQSPQRGTGDAVRVVEDWWGHRDRLLVLNGDMPLLSAATVRALLDRQRDSGAAAVLATATPPEPRAYGRILRDPANPDRIVGIVEDRQADAAQRALRELNAGFYCFAVPALRRVLSRLTTDNPHGEYYLTDAIALLARAGEAVVGLPLADPDECLGVNDRRELADLDRRLRRAAVSALFAAGVSVQLPDTVIVDPAVEVGADTFIEAGVQLLGATRIGRGCSIGAFSVLRDCQVGDGVLIRPHCVFDSAQIDAGAQLGPFTRLREGASIGAQAHVGNFVEVKKSRLGGGAKANHLAYLGDAEIGERVNVGAGTITCNYDGKSKHRTRLGAGAFIGSNATLVAPLDIGPGAYVGAGSVITDDVPADTLALGRGRQVNKPGWTSRRAQAANEPGPFAAAAPEPARETSPGGPPAGDTARARSASAPAENKKPGRRDRE